MAEPITPTAWRWGDYLLSPTQRRLWHGGVVVDLEDRVFDLLVLLLHSGDRGLDRQEIISAIWGKRPVSDATLRQLVYKARRAVGDDGTRQAVIHTLYGRSLQWIAPVESVPEPPPHVERTTGDVLPTALARPNDADPAPPVDGPVPRIVAPATGDVRTRRRAGAWIAVLAGALLLALGALAVVADMGLSARTAAPREHPTMARTTPAATISPPVTLAVLPFLAMDATQDTHYLSDGLTEELINRLGRFPKLRVAAFTSSLVYRDKAVDARAAARALGVDNIIEGSVQRTGTRLRVRAQLISAKDGYERWSGSWDPASGDVLQIEDAIATAVVRQLQPRPTPRGLAVLRGMHERAHANPAAHDFYLVGLQYLNRRTAADIRQAIVYFRRATAADPDYAQAWATIAGAYAMLREYDNETPPDTHYADALAAVQKAIALDPELAHAHAVLGLLREHHFQWAQARHEYQRALQLDPSDATAHQWYALLQWYTRDRHTALAQMRIARKLDPLSPIINTDLARTLLFNGRIDDAIAQFHATLKLDPDFALCHLLLAQADMAKGNYAAAVAASRAAVALTPTPHPASYLAVYGVALSLDGDAAGTRRQLQVLESRSRHHYVSGTTLALLQAQLGQRDQAFASLARAVADHDPLMRPAVGARASAWNGDPRFDALLVKMGLAPSRQAAMVPEN